MATSLENLRTALANVEAQIITLTASPLPDNSVDGRSEQISTHLERLVKMQESLTQAIIRAEGPAEVSVRGLV